MRARAHLGTRRTAVGARAQLNLDCAGAEPSDVDSMKRKEHQEICSLCVQEHATTHLKPDLKAGQIDIKDQGGVKRDTGRRSTHLDLSSAQPNRPANFLAHSGCRKTRLKNMLAELAKIPPRPNRSRLPERGEHEARQTGEAL